MVMNEFYFNGGSLILNKNKNPLKHKNRYALFLMTFSSRQM